MPKSNFGISSIADQRYYHFVLLRDNGGFGLASYWKTIGEIVEPARSAEFPDGKFLLQHRKLRLDKDYARGATSFTLSERGGGASPFYYDLFGGKIEVRGTAYFLLGFPFIKLAKNIVGGLIAKAKLFEAEDFAGVDVPKLVDVMERDSERRFEGMNTGIVSLQFVVTDEKALSAVRIGGDDPLSAKVYLDFLKPRIISGVVRPDVCVLACEKEWRSENRQSEDERQIFRSRLHVDGHGNFRFYTQVDCRNLRLIPYTIGQLRAIGCLKKVTANPLLRIQEELDGTSA